MVKILDWKGDILNALRKRGGTARQGVLALDLGVKPTTLAYQLSSLLKNGTLEMVKRGVVKLVRDPDGPTNLGDGGSLEVSKGVKANVVEEKKKEEAPVEEVKEAKEKKKPEAPVEEGPEVEPAGEVKEEETEETEEEELGSKKTAPGKLSGDEAQRILRVNRDKGYTEVANILKDMLGIEVKPSVVGYHMRKMSEEDSPDEEPEKAEEEEGYEEEESEGGDEEVHDLEFPRRKQKRKTRTRKLRFQDDESVTCKFKILRSGYSTGVIELPEGTALLIYDADEKRGLGDLTTDMEFTPSDKDKEGVRKLLEALKRVE